MNIFDIYSAFSVPSEELKDVFERTVVLDRSNNWRRMHGYPPRRKGPGWKRKKVVGEVPSEKLAQILKAMACSSLAVSEP